MNSKLKEYLNQLEQEYGSLDGFKIYVPIYESEESPRFIKWARRVHKPKYISYDYDGSDIWNVGSSIEIDNIKIYPTFHCEFSYVKPTKKSIYITQPIESFYEPA